MRKNLLLFIAATVLLVIAALFINDGWIYLGTALAATFIVTTIRYFRLRFLKITRWAKENPRKTQVLITVAQILILSSGLLVGYDLKELGFQLNDTPTYVFGAILILGFLSTPFLPKRKTIAIPAAVNKDRMAYMSIILSAFVIMIITGNRVEDKFPNTVLSHTLRSIDGAMFSPHNFSDDEEDPSGLVTRDLAAIGNANSTLSFASISPSEENSVVPDIHPEKDSKESLKGSKKAQKLEKKMKRMMKKIEKLRKAFAAGASVGVILLVILLIVVCCAGICIALSGGGVGSVFLGLIILGLAIFGIIKLLNGSKKVKEPKQGNT